MDEGILHAAGGVAAYRWGTFTLETDPLVAGSGRLVMDAVVSASAGSLPSRSALQQRASIAVLHELVHLQQDVTTGIGAFDHCLTRAAFPTVTLESRTLVHHGMEPPYRAAAAAALAGSSSREPVERALASIRDLTIGHRQLAGGGWDPSVLGAPAPRQDACSLRSLFEGEAAALVGVQVAGSGFDVDGHDWLDEHRALWDVLAMGEPYDDALALVIQAAYGGTPADDVGRDLGYLLVLTAWLVDVASAYPPASWLREHDARPAAFDPVARFLVMLRALFRMDGAPQVDLVADLVAGRTGAAERRLLAVADVEYPTSEDVYRAWLGELRALAGAGEWDSALFGLRAQCVERRLDGVPVKGLQGLTQAQIPVTVVVPGVGISAAVFGLQSEDAGLHLAILARREDLELYELIHGSGRMGCPWGRSALCDARVPGCLDAITRFEDLPAAGCRVRDQLERLGYAI